MPTLARPIARSPMRALFLLFALATFGLSGAGCTAETDGAAADVDTGDKADGDSDGVGCGE